MNDPWRMVRLAVVVAGLAAPGTVAAQHAGDMLLGSTAPAGGALALDFDFTRRIRVFESASGGGNTLYSSTDPGWDLVVGPGALVPLTSGTPVSVQLTALDPGVSLKIGATTLTAPGQTRLLGTAPDIHVHPSWQLVLPAGVQGERTVSFRMTTTSGAYAQSVTYTAILSNTTTTTSTIAPTTTTIGPGTTTTTTSTTLGGGGPPVTSTSTTAPSASTTSTTRPPSGPTTTTLPPRGDRLPGTTLVLRARRRGPTLSVTSRAGDVALGGARGGTADPTLHGATVHLTTGAGAAATHALPARNWRALEKRGILLGWAYGDPRRTAGPVSRVVIRQDRRLTIAASGQALGIDLASDPQPLQVVLAAGDHRWCLAFGGATRWKAGALFTARRAAAPAECSR